MVHVFCSDGPMIREPRAPANIPNAAGWVPGIPRLGIPMLLIADAGLGVTNPGGLRPGDTATAFPAGLALGSTFNPEIARAVGIIVGKEARSKGFNVLCGGGMNLPHDPRHGRNFEYISEDHRLSAVMAAETVIGRILLWCLKRETRLRFLGEMTREPLLRRGIQGKLEVGRSKNCKYLQLNNMLSHLLTSKSLSLS